MMNLYKKGFFLLLSIYEKFSKDDQIGIFAFGLYTVLAILNIMSIWYTCYYYIFGYYQPGFPGEIVIGIVTFIFNLLYFIIPGDKRNDEYFKYLSSKKRSHYFWLLLYFVITISTVSTLATGVRNTKMELKEQYKVNFNNWNH